MNSKSLTTLQQLRMLTPQRPLTFGEACDRAEVQAIALLALHDINRPPVPIDLVVSLPRIRVAFEAGLPVSGSAYWDGHGWVVTLNSDEPVERQRFSVMHELKHIIDHPTRHLIEPCRRWSADEYHERLADHFAACVLMPRTWVKRAWQRNLRDPALLASRFGVSKRAMLTRLDALGINLGPSRGCVIELPYNRDTCAAKGAAA